MISKDLKRNVSFRLKEIEDYVKSTYGEHYVGEAELQVIDLLESLGSIDTFCRDTALKYMARYGKKSGKNKKDLLKAIHYLLLLLEADHGKGSPRP
jgi:hypothetical protein